MKIFIYAHLDEPAKAHLRESLSGHEAYWADKHAPTPADVKAFSTSEICFGNVPAEWLQAETKLRWLQLESVGFEYYQKCQALVTQKNILITNLRGMFAKPAAESAVGGLLALLRGIDELAMGQNSRRWISLEVRPRMGLLHGRKVLILGMGSIGQKVGAMLKAFECEVSYYARTNPEATFRSPEQLDARLHLFSVVVNCLPNTPETENFFHRDRLRRLSREAIFVNVGRGSTVDEPALVELLQAGKIGGAVLDVFKQEPLPPSHPLWSCPRTIILQHTGGGYADELLDKARFFVVNLDFYQQGQPVQNRINLTLGY
jgi:phosphoglycerate dehydrogenase-like enzyme